MRNRIKNVVNVQNIIDEIEHKRKIYTICIKDIMQSNELSYFEAKQFIKLRTISNQLFKTS